MPMRLMHPLRDREVDRRTVPAGSRPDGSPLLADVTLPAGQGPWPAVLIVHGALPPAMAGSLRESAMYRDWGAALAAKGAAGVMFDHSLDWPDLRAEGALSEIDQVLAWMAADGPGMGLDLRRLTAIIVSGGGVLASELLCGARPLRIAGASLFSPLTGVPAAEEPWRTRLSLAAAAGALAERDARLMIFRGGGDAPELLALMDQTIRALLAADINLVVHNLRAAPHCYEVQLESPAVEQAIERALEFAVRFDGAWPGA